MGSEMCIRDRYRYAYQLPGIWSDPTNRNAESHSEDELTKTRRAEDLLGDAQCEVSQIITDSFWEHDNDGNRRIPAADGRRQHGAT